MAVGEGIPGYDVAGPVGFGVSGAAHAVRGADGRPWVASVVPGGDRVERIRRLAHLHHPHLPAVHDIVSMGDETVAVVMELIIGPSLATVVNARTWLGTPEVVTVWRAVADALAAMHDRGLVHGDVSPANILLGPGGRPVLIDIVGHGGAERGHTGYIPPELDDGPATAASDVWSLARTLAWASGDDPRVLAAVGAALGDDPGDRPPARDFATWAFLLGDGGQVEVPGAATLAGAQLRAAAAPTLLTPRPRRPRWGVAVAAVLTVLLTMLFARPSAAEVAPRHVQEWATTLTAHQAEEVSRLLLARRDDALAARDPAALAELYLPGSSSRDDELIRVMLAEGTEFRGYRTSADWLGPVSRAPGRFVARLEVRQLAHERVVGGAVVSVAEQPAHCVEVELAAIDGAGPEEWRIARVGPCADGA